jgi:spore maturation protein CgeB
MEKKWNKKILLVLMQWDYCDKKRGPSSEKNWYYDNFVKLVSDVDVFWYDEYINDLPNLQIKIIEKAKDSNPDLIFFFPYTNQFQYKTLDYLKTKCLTCAWFGDDTWRFDSYSSKLAKHFSHICTTDIFRIPDYKKLGINPILTQWAAQLYGKRDLDLQKINYKYDVSFVGAYNEVRGWFISFLKSKGINVVCFGAGWKNGKVKFEEMENIFRESRINLNLSNSVANDIRYVFSGIKSLVRWLISKKKAEQIKARNFEIPAAGGFQLTNYVVGMEKYFEIGGEIAVFSSPEESLNQIRYYLSNEDKRMKILRAGHRRTENEHTYFQRLEKILEIIWR